MIRLWFNLKRLKQNLRQWNKVSFKNLFSNVLEEERYVQNVENNYFLYPSIINLELLNETKVKLIYLHEMEEAY